MKRTISLWLGLLAFALLPVLAQTPEPAAPQGKIHGHVTNPTGVSADKGTVSLSTDGGMTAKFSFPVTKNGDYTGEATPGTYTIVFRMPETPADKMVDSLPNVKIALGGDTLQDIDMTRKEFIDALSTEQKKALEEIKKKNSEVMKANEVVRKLNADLAVVAQDMHEADGARAAAKEALGAAATRADIDAKEAEIKTAKYTDVESMMQKDTVLRPDAPMLWAHLGQAETGLKKYDEAEAAYKKALELETTGKKPDPQLRGVANAGLGEIYARTAKVPEASAAYDAAAKADPTQAAVFLKNEAVIFSQVGNADAQVAAAEAGIQADPKVAILYYLKGQGLVGKATVDPKTNRIILPEGCAEAYQKYLELAPTGQYAADVKGILDQAGQKVVSTFTADKKKK